MEIFFGCIRCHTTWVSIQALAGDAVVIDAGTIVEARMVGALAIPLLAIHTYSPFKTVLFISINSLLLIHDEEMWITYETVEAGAIICGNSVVACATIKTRTWPAFVPVNFTIDPRVTVNAVTGIGAMKNHKMYI